MIWNKDYLGWGCAFSRYRHPHAACKKVIQDHFQEAWPIQARMTQKSRAYTWLFSRWYIHFSITTCCVTADQHYMLYYTSQGFKLLSIWITRRMAFCPFTNIPRLQRVALLGIIKNALWDNLQLDFSINTTYTKYSTPTVYWGCPCQKQITTEKMWARVEMVSKKRMTRQSNECQIHDFL